MPSFSPTETETEPTS